MDNAQKAIMIGVGLFITIIIIAAVMLITGMGQDMINSSTTQVSNISTSLQAQLTSQYDGTVLNGSQVISAVKANYTTEGMVIIVDNGTENGKTDYGRSIISDPTTITVPTDKALDVKAITVNNNPTTVGKLSDASSSSTYVATSSRYNANLIKISDAVVGICFKRK